MTAPLHESRHAKRIITGSPTGLEFQDTGKSGNMMANAPIYPLSILFFGQENGHRDGEHHCQKLSRDTLPVCLLHY